MKPFGEDLNVLESERAANLGWAKSQIGTMTAPAWIASNISEAKIISITARGKTFFYVYSEIPCEIGGRGFAIQRVGSRLVYHTRVSNNHRDCSCDCKGFLKWNHCKHLITLLEAES